MEAAAFSIINLALATGRALRAALFWLKDELRSMAITYDSDNLGGWAAAWTECHMLPVPCFTDPDVAPLQKNTMEDFVLIFPFIVHLSSNTQEGDIP